MARMIDEADVWVELKKIYDPEIPTSIVDLGLIYAVDVDDKIVHITMTFTSPACAMAPYLVEQIRQNLLTIPDIQDVKVKVVWDPPWNQSMISEVGKMELGLL